VLSTKGVARHPLVQIAWLVVIVNLFVGPLFKSRRRLSHEDNLLLTHFDAGVMQSLPKRVARARHDHSHLLTGYVHEYADRVQRRCFF
jgi:hypothetical protein